MPRSTHRDARREGDAVRAAVALRARSARTALAKTAEMVGVQAEARDGSILDVAGAFPTSAQEAIEEVAGLISWSLWGAAKVVEDCALGITELVESGPETQISCIVLGRSALESGCVGAYCLDQDVTPETLIGRGLTHLLWQDHDDEKALAEADWQAVPGFNPASPHAWQEQRLTELTETLGWKVRRSKRGQLLKLTPKGNLPDVSRISTTRIIKDIADERGITAWRIGSGASHGRPWALRHEMMSPDAPMAGATAVTAYTALIAGASPLIKATARCLDDPQLTKFADKLEAEWLTLGRGMADNSLPTVAPRQKARRRRI